MAIDVRREWEQGSLPDGYLYVVFLNENGFAIFIIYVRNPERSS
jgi:hypothetical protein